jgi:large repetitive protein
LSGKTGILSTGLIPEANPLINACPPINQVRNGGVTAGVSLQVFMKCMKFILPRTIVFLAIQEQAAAQCMNAIIQHTFDCPSSSATASVQMGNPSGTPPYTYTWTPGGYTTQSVSNLPVGAYTVTIKDANNCITTANTFVSYPYPPVSLVFTTTMVTCFNGFNGGATAMFSTSNSPPFTYTWVSTSGPFHYGSVATGLGAGVYTVTVRDSKGCGTTNTVLISQPALIDSTPSTTSLTCHGQTVNVSITTVGGFSPYTYTLNGNPLTGNVANGLVAGSYTLKTTDSKQCVVTEFIQIQQPPANQIQFSKNPPTCKYRSDGTINAQVNGPGTAPYSYSWQPGGGAFQQHSSIPMGTYTLTITDANSCVTSSVVQLQPIPPMQPLPATHPENCSAVDGAFTMNIAQGTPPFTFTTMPGASNGSVQTQLSSGTYTVFFEDSNGCVDTTEVTVGNLSTVQLNLMAVKPPQCHAVCDGSFVVSVANAVHPVTYSVSGQPTTAVAAINGLCSGNYLVKAIDAIGCPATGTINFPAVAVFSYSAAPPPSICQGNVATLHAEVIGGDAPHQITWYPGAHTGINVSVSPMVTTTYSLMVTDAKGCSRGAKSVVVQVASPLTIGFNESAAGVCPGATAQISPTVTGGDGNYTYSWQPGNSSAPFIFVQSVNLSDYSLTVKDGCGSPEASAVLKLKVFPVTQPVFSVSAQTGCVPLCVRLENVTPGSSGAVWNTGDQPRERGGEAVDYCYATAGSYNLRLSVKDINNCHASFTYSNAIVALPKPVVTISDPGYLTMANADNVEFRAGGSGAGSFAWVLDGVKLGSGLRVVHSFPDTGCHYLKLVGYAGNSCRDSSERSLCIYEGFSFYMPNAFTPNGDGLNDQLLPKGAGWLYDDYLFEIYARWGTLVFRSRDVSKGWDGGYHESKNVPGTYLADKNDAYLWRVEVRDNTGELHEKRGVVVLVR